MHGSPGDAIREAGGAVFSAGTCVASIMRLAGLTVRGAVWSRDVLSPTRMTVSISYTVTSASSSSTRRSFAWIH